MPAARDLDSLVARFLDRRLPRDAWTHQAHLAVNSDTSGYHETITRAYLDLLASFVGTCPPAASDGDVVARVLAGPLAEPGLLLRCYSRERLFSVDARTEWVAPDLAALNLGTVFGSEFTATLFRYPGKGGWTFAPVPAHLAPPVTHGWGRTPVRADVDGRTWNTSVWRGADGRTLLAVPKRVRGGKRDGDVVQVRLSFGEIT